MKQTQQHCQQHTATRSTTDQNMSQLSYSNAHNNELQ